ncbi:MAG TPA: sialidase family protein [Bryobacteraceae bacterium]|nr:sialidase family protein [Bryobacteraceae bacterium]
MSTVIHGPRANRRVTCDSNPQNARSESDISVNPLNPYNMVGSSKRFTDLTNYAFSLAAYATFDGGETWIETVLPLTDTNGTVYPSTTDPAVAFDDLGNVYIIALPWQGDSGPNSGQTIGISVYMSTDGGATWGKPVLIHSSTTDDKQAVWADTSPTSPYKGNVYAVWDDTATGGLLFARTTNHGASWIGLTSGGSDQPAGTPIPGVFDSYSPEVTVAADGTVIVAWAAWGSGLIEYVTSTDGGATFSAVQTAATGITDLENTLSTVDGWPVFPNATFRVFTFVTVITSASNLIVAWADTRNGNSQIYYRVSPDMGSSWNGPASGQPMLTGGLASSAGMNDFHAQLATAPTGEVGCAFYEYGPRLEGEGFTEYLITVNLAVSIDGGNTFSNRAIVSDQPWNPAIDAPHADALPSATFIGDYFGFLASSLGFFPLWTDTRTGIQEMYIARLSLYPADLYMRDGPSDVGNVPSPDAVFWESPDMVVRHQPDGDVNFVDQGLLRDGVTTHYVYGRATNRGPNDTPAATFAVTVGNFPSLLGLPGSEFWYPQDWYQQDWNTAALRNNHLWLGTSDPLPIPNGQTVILGPVVWPANKIPVEGTWHPCLLGEVRCGNDDSAGGTNGAEIPADPSATCPHGAFVYGNNDVCQRNLTYVPVHHMRRGEKLVSLPFVAGSVWDNKARTIEIMVDKGIPLAQVPMTLRMEPIALPGKGGGTGAPQPEPVCCEPGEIVFTGNCRVIVRVGRCEAGEIITTPGTIWRSHCPEKPKTVALPLPLKKPGAEQAPQKGMTWQLLQPKSVVSFPVGVAEMRKLTLTFTVPDSLAETTTVRIWERKDGSIVTGGISIQLQV